MRLFIFFPLILWLAFSPLKALSSISVRPLSSAYPSMPPPAWERADRAVWSVRGIGGNSAVGTGFFVGKRLFVTNFHVLLALLETNEAHDIILSQKESSSVLKIKKTLALSALYDLALLEIEGSAPHFLEVKSELPSDGAALFLSSYLGHSDFKRIKKTGKIFYKDDQSYIFPVDHSRLAGISGSPVLNRKGQAVGVSFQSEGENILAVIKPYYLKRFILRREGSACSGFKDIELCIKKEMDNLKRAAKKGQPAASHHLFRLMYYSDRGSDEDFDLAGAWLKKAVDQNHAKALHLKANMHYAGTLAEQNIFQALFLWQKAAKQNYALSQYNLAIKGDQIMGGAALIQWLRRAAGNGYVKAQYDLAVINYNDGNRKKAILLFKQAAEQGYAKAQTFLEKL